MISFRSKGFLTKQAAPNPSNSSSVYWPAFPVMKQQLASTAASLAEIALAAGFADQSHFSRTIQLYSWDYRLLLGDRTAEVQADGRTPGLEGGGLCGHLLVQHDRASLVEDAQVRRPSMQIDSAIKCV
jgi:hypothetical protein